jgi:glyoxylase-like metal-dependent hydrolase (beta-lactamase superfamily II)
MISETFGRVYCIDTLLAGIEEFLSCFLVKDEKIVLSDPGPPCVAKEVLKSIEEVAGCLDYIALSHIHVDHAGASYILAKAFDAEILVHPKAAKHLINPERLWESSLQALGNVADIYGKPEPIEEEKIVVVRDGEIIRLGEEKMRAIYTPGHATHHVSYFLENSKLLLSGESVGMLLRGRIIPTSPLPPMTFEDVRKSFEKMKALSPKRLAFCHFGFAEPDLMGRVERKIEEWFQIAGGIKKGAEEIERFSELLVERDEDYRYLMEYYAKDPKAKLIFSYPYRTILKGILDLVRR